MQENRFSRNSAYVAYNFSQDSFLALAVYQTLRDHGIDAFIDVLEPNQRDLSTATLNSIIARVYFVLVVSFGDLDGFNDSQNNLRISAELAVANKRKIFVIRTPELNLSEKENLLVGSLSEILKAEQIEIAFNAPRPILDQLPVRLVPIDLPITPLSTEDEITVQKKLQQANAASSVTDNQIMAQGYLVQSNKREFGDFIGMISDCDKAIHLEPGLIGGYMKRAFIRSLTKDFKGMLEDYDTALRLDPKNGYIYYMRGFGQMLIPDYRGTIADYTRTIALLPDDAMLYRVRADMYSLLKDYNPAIADYTEAIRLMPTDGESYQGRGVTRHNNGDYLGAIRDLTEALRLGSKHAERSYIYRGNARYVLEDQKSAETDYTEAIYSKSEYIEAYYNRGCIRQLKQDWKGAIADFSQTIKLDAKYFRGYVGRGLVLHRSGDRRAASADYRQALSLIPDTKQYQQYRTMVIALAKNAESPFASFGADLAQVLRPVSPP